MSSEWNVYYDEIFLVIREFPFRLRLPRQYRDREFYNFFFRNVCKYYIATFAIGIEHLCRIRNLENKVVFSTVFAYSCIEMNDFETVKKKLGKCKGSTRRNNVMSFLLSMFFAGSF